MSRLRTFGILIALVVVAVGLRVMDANPAVAQTAIIGAWRFSVDPGMDGTAASWQSVPAMWVSMTPQAVTPPMGGGEVPRVGVRAGHWDGRLYVMLEWADSTADVAAARVEDFVDAAAVQFPAVAGSAVPALCMGQADEAVNIWHWRADHAPAAIEDLGPADLYPFADDLYFTARAAGNPLATPANTAHNLLAGGFGTLAPAAQQVVSGNGVHAQSRWTVVLSRPLASPGEFQPVFSAGTPIDTTFAVWNGSLDHRDGIKSVSSFVQLRLTDQPPPGEAAQATTRRILVVPAAGLILLTGLAFFALRDHGPDHRGH